MAPTIRLLEGTGSWTLPHIGHFPLLALKSTLVMRQKLGMCWQLLTGNPQKVISQCVPHKIPVSSVSPRYCPLSTLAIDLNRTYQGLSEAKHIISSSKSHNYLITEALFVFHTPCLLALSSETISHPSALLHNGSCAGDVVKTIYLEAEHSSLQGIPGQHARSGGHQSLRAQSSCAI